MAPDHDDVAERDAHCGAGEEDDPVLGFVESLVVLDSVVEWGISDASVRRSAMLQVRGCAARGWSSRLAFLGARGMHGLPRVPGDLEDHGREHEPDDRVADREAESHDDSARDHSE
jgi:hypothetical protein